MDGRDSVSVCLRQRGEGAWEQAIRHPMVREIAAGSLPYDTFRHYFQQNILYLEDYARAIASVISNAPDHAAMRLLNRFLGQIVNTEIPTNHQFLRRLGGDAAEVDLSRMSQVTHGYTRHILHETGKGDCAAGLAAILPCQWSYGELAQPLMSNLPDDAIYADWISMFGNDEYAAHVDETTALLDRLAESSDGSAMDRLAWIFDVSTRYEVRFWDMAYGRSGWS